MIKYNSLGVEQWTANYELTPTAFALDEAGNVYVTGFYDGNKTIKYDSQGRTLWVKHHDSLHFASRIEADQAGNLYLIGQPAPGNGHYAVVKVNRAGIPQWAAYYTGLYGGYEENIADVYVDRADHVYITGSNNYDYATVKYNRNGALQWAARYNSPGNLWERAKSISVDNAGNVYVTGVSGTNLNVTPGECVTIKYDSTGKQQWMAKHSGLKPFSFTPIAVAVDSAGNAIVAGSDSGEGWSVFSTIKYGNTLVAVEDDSKSAPSQYALGQNYPNPFKPATTIRYAIPKAVKVVLRIYDLLGHEIATLVDETQAPGEHAFDWNPPTNLANGVYFYRLRAGSFDETKKLVVSR